MRRKVVVGALCVTALAGCGNDKGAVTSPRTHTEPEIGADIPELPQSCRRVLADRRLSIPMRQAFAKQLRSKAANKHVMLQMCTSTQEGK